MRKVTNIAVNNFLNGIGFSISNTTVKVLNNGDTILSLFGNNIAKRKDDKLFIQTAGWDSNTTLERLNALPNVKVQRVKGKLKLNGEEWDDCLS